MAQCMDNYYVEIVFFHEHTKTAYLKRVRLVDWETAVSDDVRLSFKGRTSNEIVVYVPTLISKLWYFCKTERDPISPPVSFSSVRLRRNEFS